MNRKFTSSLALMLLLNLLVKPIWIFGIDRTVQNLVGASEYGLFFALFNFSLLLNITLDFGLTNFNNREISQHSQLLPRYLSNIIVLKLMLAVIYLLLSFSIGFALGYSGRQLWILSVLALNQILSSIILYLRSNISALQLFKTDSIISVTDRALMIALCSLLLWTPLREQFKIEWFAYAQTLAYGVTALVAFAVVLSKSALFKPKFNRLFFISIAKQSYPYAILALLMSIHYRIDSVMLERLLPDGALQAGIYAQAFRLLDAATMVPFLFATLLLPMFSRMLKMKEDVSSLLGFSSNLVIAGSLLVTIVCVGYRDQIMDLLYLNNTQSSSIAFSVLMLSFVFSSISLLVGTLLTANGNIFELNIVALVGVVVNVSVNIFFIYSHKALGAAIASLITQAIIATLQAVLTYRIFRFKVKFLNILKFSLMFLSSLGALYLSSLLHLSWIIGSAVTVFVGLSSVLVLRIIRPKELIKLYLNPR